MRKVHVGILAAFFLTAASLTGCVSLDKNSVAASNQIPGHAQVEPIAIAYDPKLPKYVVVVEPFLTNTQGQVIEIESTGRRRCAGAECSSTITNKSVAQGVSSQLITALTNAGNLSVVDLKAVKRNKNGTYQARIAKGERGPFIIRGAVTEFSENVASSNDSTGVSLGWTGLIAGIAGAYTGNNGLFWAGTGVAAANPTFEAELASRTGMIAFDVQVVNGKTGRIIRAFNVAGTFTAKSATNGASLFGIGGSKTEFVQSAMGQAVRVAMNDAVLKTFESLKGA